MDEGGLAFGEGQAVGADGLDPVVVGAGFQGLGGHRFDAFLQGGEQGVLLADGKGEKAVEELGHRRQILIELALVDDLEAGGVLEALDAPALDAAAVEGGIEAPEGGLGVIAFQVVLGPEHGPASAHGGLGVALAAGDGAEAVEPAGYGRDEPPLALDIGGDGAEQGRRGLMGAVGAPQTLDCLVGAPTRFEKIVDSARGVATAEVGVVAAPGAAGHGENEDLLLAGHEGVCLGEVGGSRPAAQA